MSKLLLKDKTEIEVIESSVNESQFSVECSAEEMVEVFNHLNQRTLSRFELKNEESVFAIFVNKDVESCEYKDGVATFKLRTVDITEARITALEDGLAELTTVIEAIMEGDEE